MIGAGLVTQVSRVAEVVVVMRLVQCRLLAHQADDAAASLDLEDINATGADHRVIMDSRIVNPVRVTVWAL